MNALLKFITFTDHINRKIGQFASGLVLLACLVSSFNAVIRYLFGISSNGWLELQWYMFAGIVLLGAPAVLSLNEHVRVDVFYGNYAPRTSAWIDICGGILFLLPMCLILFWLSLPLALDSLATAEMSSQAQGLVRWPVKMLIPLGSVLLVLQGVAEIFKRFAYLRGQYNMDSHYEKPLQ
jgi:TRAP-type mannitol/chloroaromatic compound transport system permease small subunit